jgi:type II pantothenate kinase
MLVKDIYGTNSPFKELDGDILASSFGKIAYDQTGGPVKDRHNVDDILNSLVTMISFNIGQLAFYCSSMHAVKSIHFVGSYVRDNYLACQ